MAKKKSVKTAVKNFLASSKKILDYTNKCSKVISDKYHARIYDYAIIWLYREFESLMLEVLIGAVNNDTSVLSTNTGFQFPKHLTDEVCEYIITKDGYFDFKGRDGLIKELKKYLPADPEHYLLAVIRNPAFKERIELLCALRNFAAHYSEKSKRAVLNALHAQRIRSSGGWLKNDGRFEHLLKEVNAVARAISAKAPY